MTTAIRHGLQLQLASPRLPEAARLITALDDHQLSLYPPEACYRLDVSQLEQPEVRFYLAYVDGQAAGCAALVAHHGYVEVKRMYVDPIYRGRGVASALLGELDRLALELGSVLARLETGPFQPEAIALYRKHGFIERGPYGDYPADPYSVFMEKLQA